MTAVALIRLISLSGYTRGKSLRVCVRVTRRT